MSNFTGLTCGIYPRVSTKAQAKEDKSSLDDQEQSCRVYAADLGMEVDPDCVLPEAYTSTNQLRPALNKLLASMVAHRVPNLIIDIPDRLTRAGSISAARFLIQFIEAGIVLHVAYTGLIVKDEDSYHEFLQAAHDANKDNERRTLRSHRGKVSRAKRGTFIRGNHAPYGFWYRPIHDEIGNVIDRQLVPDERTYEKRGFLTEFARTPYESRRKILHMYTEEGLSFQIIANRLNDARVPTAHAILRREDTTGLWYARTVNWIVQHPVNEGRLVNHFSYKDEPGKPHQPDETVEVESKYGNPIALVSEREKDIIAQRRQRNLETYYARSSALNRTALLHGRLAKCAWCGGTVRAKVISYKGQPRYPNYVCKRHEDVPSACPGWALRVEDVDFWAWEEVIGALARLNQTGPNGDSEPDGSEPEPGARSVSYVDLLAMIDVDRENAAAQSGLSPAASLDNLIAARDSLQVKADRLAETIALTEDAFARATLLRQLESLRPELQQANMDIARAGRQLEQQAQRVQLLADFLDRYKQYQDVLLKLDTRFEEDIPIMKGLLYAIGAQFTLDPKMFVKARAEGQEPDIMVDITLTPAAALPWLTVEEMGRIIDERRECNIQMLPKELGNSLSVSPLIPSGNWRRRP